MGAMKRFYGLAFKKIGNVKIKKEKRNIDVLLKTKSPKASQKA